jgi:four helix bundle protein
MNPTTCNGTSATRFVAYDLCLDIICRLQAPLAVIRRHNASLARQGTNAIDSVLLNLAEGNGREGGDRLHHFRIALGSLREAGAVLDIAGAHGWLPKPPPLHLERDRLCGIIYGLQRSRR